MSKYKKGDRFWFEIKDVIEANDGKTMYECDNGGYAADGILDGFNIVVQCSDCRHRPTGKSGERFAEPPFKAAEDGTVTDERDYTCPFIADYDDDNYYCVVPKDDFFCPYGELRPNEREN